ILANGITPALAPDVFLGVPGTATEWKVTSWRKDTTQPGELDLLLPAAYADVATAAPPPPAAMPLPGVYNLTVGGAAPNTRSNAIPLAIAPRVDNVAIPPTLKPDPNTGVYSVHGAGFVPAATIVALGTIPLTAAAAPGPGQYAINAAGTAIDFLLPSPKPPPGSYPLLIQTNGIAAAPGWIVSVTLPALAQPRAASSPSRACMPGAWCCGWSMSGTPAKRAPTRDRPSAPARSYGCSPPTRCRPPRPHFSPPARRRRSAPRPTLRPWSSPPTRHGPRSAASSASAPTKPICSRCSSRARSIPASRA